MTIFIRRVLAHTLLLVGGIVAILILATIFPLALWLLPEDESADIEEMIK